MYIYIGTHCYYNVRSYMRYSDARNVVNALSEYITVMSFFIPVHTRRGYVSAVAARVQVYTIYVRIYTCIYYYYITIYIIYIYVVYRNESRNYKMRVFGSVGTRNHSLPPPMKIINIINIIITVVVVAGILFTTCVILYARRQLNVGTEVIL